MHSYQLLVFIETKERGPTNIPIIEWECSKIRLKRRTTHAKTNNLNFNYKSSDLINTLENFLGESENVPKIMNITRKNGER